MARSNPHLSSLAALFDKVVNIGISTFLEEGASRIETFA